MERVVPQCWCYTSLLTEDSEHLVKGFIIIFMSSLGKCLFESFAGLVWLFVSQMLKLTSVRFEDL